MGAKVSITKCGVYDGEEVYASVKASIDLLGGMDRFVKRGERVLIKPNILAAKPPEAAVTTHPGVVTAVIRLVKEAGGEPLVGDSPGLGKARKAADKCGIIEACTASGAEFIEFRELVRAENPSGHTFKRLDVAKEVLGVDAIINVPKLKTHAQMFLTLGVKNLFGCVPGKKKAQWHLSAGVDSRDFAGMLLDLYLFLNPRLNVMDGVVGMEGNGPGNGDPRKIGLIFASENAIAMDVVAALVLGAKPSDLPVLKAAQSRNIKEAEASNIEVLGERMENVRVRGFRFPPLVSADFAAGLPPFIGKRLRKMLTSRPHVNRSACTLCNVCVDVCPPGVMEKAGGIEIDYERCIRCYCCQEMCPHGAISPKDGWLKKIVPGL